MDAQARERGGEEGKAGRRWRRESAFREAYRKRVSSSPHSSPAKVPVSRFWRDAISARPATSALVLSRIPMILIGSQI